MTNNSLSARVVKAMTLFGGVKIVEILCGVVRNKLLAVLVGPAGIGLNAVFNRAMEMVSGVTQLNLRQSSVRELSGASSAERPGIISAVVWWALRLGIAGALVMLVLSPGISWLSFDSMGSWWLFALVGIAVMAQSVTNGDLAILQATDRLKVLAKSQVLTALSVMIVCVGCYAAFGIAGVVPGLIISYIVSFVITRKCRGKISAPTRSLSENMATGRKFLSLGFSLGVGMMISAVCAYCFIAWINRESGEDITGIYQAGYMLIINYAGVVFTAISMDFYPRLVKVIDRPKLASTIVSHEISTLLLVLVPVIAIFIPMAPLMIKILYSHEFVAAIPMVTIGICGIVFRAVSFCMAYAIIARGDGKTYIVTESLSSVAGLALNIIMYKTWGFAGLGVSYIIWYAIYTLIVTVPYRRYGLSLARPTLRLVAVASAMAALSYAVNLAGWWASVILATICVATASMYMIKILYSKQ